MKNVNQTLINSPNVAKFKAWIIAARPKTWIASISPVLMAGAMSTNVSTIYLFLCLFFALFLQIGCNLANDYFDFIKGADTIERIGPKRAVQQGWISPKSMKNGFIFVLSFAFILSLPLIAKVHPLCLLFSIAAIATSVAYTGGKNPLGYLGLGEVFVFVFFGLVAVNGTFLVLEGTFSETVFIASIAPGCFSTALILANNLRDEATDKMANKKTLVVRFGAIFGKILFSICLIIPSLACLALIIWFDAPKNLLSAAFLSITTISVIKQAFLAKNPQELSLLLPITSLLFIFFTALFCLSYIY